MRRRKLLTLTGSSLAVALAGCSGDSDGDGDEDESENQGGVASGSPMFQYDAANTGATTNQTGPTSGVTERWSVNLQSNTALRVQTAPAVVDDTVYVCMSDGVVYSLSVDDGTEQWTYDAEGDSSSSPAVVDGTVYVGSSGGDLYALSAADGSEQWTFEVFDSVRIPTLSSPAVVDDTVFISHSRTPSDGQVFAVDAATGTERWGVSIGTGVSAAPAVDDERVYVSGNDDLSLHALGRDDGDERWTFEMEGEPTAPTVLGETVYVGENTLFTADDRQESEFGRVYAIDATDGTEQWSFEVGSAVRSSVAVSDGTVYCGSQDQSVYAVNAEDGTQEWSYGTNDFIASSPIVTDQTLFIGSFDSTVYALNAADGTERWTFETGDSVGATPAVTSGNVYIGSYDGFVYRLAEG